MTNAILIRFVALLVVLTLWAAQSPAQEYVLTVANEQLSFVAQPEAGYVVKTQEKTGGISTLSGTLSFLASERATPIRGLDRHGIWVVERQQPASENEKTIKMLRADRQIEYAAPLFSSNGETVAVIPEIVIRVHPGVNARQVHFLCQSLALAIIKPMEFTTQEYLLQVLGPDAEAVFKALENLNKVEWIEWAAPNTAFQPKLLGKSVPDDHDSVDQLRFDSSAGQDANSPGVFPDDEYFPMQWHLHNTGQSGGAPGADIRAPEAWEITSGDPNIVVAVFDSGVDANHPDLIDNLVPGYDFLDNDAQPDPSLDHPSNAHGTMCAGLIAAQGDNSIGVAGATWNCKIMPIRIFGFRADGTGLWLTQAEEATGFRWAAGHGVDIFSNSWVESKNPTPILYSAIVDVTKPSGIGRSGKGCIVLFAAGNDSGPLQWYPQKYPEVIAVGATDHNDARCYYSSYGPELDIVAPSGPGYTMDDWLNTKGRGWAWTTDISGPAGWNMDPFDPNVVDYTALGGTSGACPVAAGVAALILSIEPNLTGDEVRHFLERSAKDLGAPGRDNYYGRGRVDARAALDMVLAKRADLNDDWKVDFSDFAVLGACWNTDDLRGDIGPAPRPDGAVDVRDLGLMGEYWLTEIPDPAMLAHWRLDETEGSIAYDSAGDYDNSLNGGPIWQPAGGKVGGALLFDGINDYISTPYVLNPATGPFSVFAWTKGGAPGRVIISQANGEIWLGADNSYGKLLTSLKDVGSSTPGVVSEFVITDGEWHRAGFVWDGGRRHLYADDAEVAADSSNLPRKLVSYYSILYIGAGKSREAGSFWSGLIDDIKIYNRAITP